MIVLLIFAIFNCVFVKNTDASSKPIISSALDNRTRLIATIFDEPSAMLARTESDYLSDNDLPAGTILNPSQVKGYLADLASTIFEKELKIPYKFVIEKAYGGEIGQGVWNGLMGALANRSADLAIAQMVITRKRAEVVDFSYPFMSSGISLMMFKPPKMRPAALSVIHVFSKELWICLIIAYVFVRIIAFIIHRLTNIHQSQPKDTKRTTADGTLSQHKNCFFLMNDLLHFNVPRSCSGRLFIAVWWFFLFIVTSWYLVHLITIDAAPTTGKTIRTMENLAQQRDIEYGVRKGGSIMAFFSNSQQSTIKTLWNVMKQRGDNVFVTSNEEGIAKVRKSKGKYAFFINSLVNEYVNGRLPCDTIQINEIMAVRHYGIATPKRSDLREVINQIMLGLTESGYLDQLKQKWFVEQNECEQPIKNYLKPRHTEHSTITDMMMVFYILIVGMILSVILGLIEFLLKTKSDSKRSNTPIGQCVQRNFRVVIRGRDGGCPHPIEEEQLNVH